MCSISNQDWQNYSFACNFMRLHCPQRVMGRDESSVFSYFSNWNALSDTEKSDFHLFHLNLHFTPVQQCPLLSYTSIFSFPKVPLVGCENTHHFSGEKSLWNHHDDHQIIRMKLGRGGTRWHVSSATDALWSLYQPTSPSKKDIKNNYGLFKSISCSNFYLFWQGCPLSPLLFNIVLEFLARAITQEEGIQIGKETQNIPICRWQDPIPQSSKKFYPKTPRHHKCFSNVAGFKINLQKQLAFLYTNKEQIEKKIYGNNSNYSSLNT
jgi:hypothetical protein